MNMRNKILVFYIDSRNKEYIEEYYANTNYLKDIIFIKNTDIYLELNNNNIIFKIRGKDLDLNTVKGAYFTNTIHQQYVITKLLEINKVVCVPSFKTINITSNKLLQNICFVLNNINIPKSIYSRNINNIVPKLPLVKKPVSGSLGNGISVIFNDNEVGGSSVFYQNIVETENPKYDLRLIVSKNDGFICAEKRIALNDSFVTNISKRNKGEAYTPSSKEIKLAIRVLKSIPNMYYGGVDLIKDVDNKYYVLEINSCPGNKIIDLTGINFYGRIIDYLIKL